ncbi:MAG: four helix bundle protein [Kiritimatiellae bacterium]|nr:four helix bundle protein [Kiritimatiellia bacterium]MBP5786623.1 four helix bundle protein [Kiritimatiellia bacterium]
MAAFKTFEEINVWQNARVLVRDVYAVTRSGDFAKDYGLKDQIQRAAISICSNIAEGFERRGNREFVKFLWIAKGSAAEVCSQLHNARDIGYITDEQFKSIYDSAKQIGGMIFNLITVLSSTDTRTKP